MPTHQGKTQTDIVICDCRPKLIPIIPKQRFDFSFLGSSSSSGLVVLPALDVIGYKSAWLLVRCHSSSIGSGGQFDVNVYGVDPSDSDTQEFTNSTALMTVTIDSTTAPPKLLSDSDTNLYPYLKIGVMATQGSTAGAALFAEISADLVVREA